VFLVLGIQVTLPERMGMDRGTEVTLSKHVNITNAPVKTAILWKDYFKRGEETMKKDRMIMASLKDVFIVNQKNHTRTINVQDPSLPTIYIITPTYSRPSQLPDMTRLSQTLMHVPSIVWLVVEDATSLNPIISDLLIRSGIPHVYLNAPMPLWVVYYFSQPNITKCIPKGTPNRNKALQWIKSNENTSKIDSRGIIYFADDDNTYDLRLFHEIRSIKKVGMWPVGLVAGLNMSAPIVKNSTIIGFMDGWEGKRKFPVDMAGFGLTVKWFLSRKEMPVMPYLCGRMEDIFLKRLDIEMEDVEPLAKNCTEVYVWHTRTQVMRKSRRAHNATISSPAINGSAIRMRNAKLNHRLLEDAKQNLKFVKKLR
jgi:hypothetical protein